MVVFGSVFDVTGVCGIAPLENSSCATEVTDALNHILNTPRWGTDVDVRSM